MNFNIMDKILNYIELNKEKHLNELIEFLKIPSISAVPAHNPDVERCAEWLSGHIKTIGFDDVRLINTPGHPIVFAQWLGAVENAKTVLIYGHYDVQPVEPLDEWNSEPFNPVVHDGKIWARGTADDKGQVFVHLKALEAYHRVNGKFPVNIKLLIEGEEEAGSSNLDDFIVNNAELLACDTVIISDTEWITPTAPSICVGLRGISFIEVTVHGPNRDVHSGSYGGGIDNPLNVLCRMVSQLTDCYGRITIPGFYDDVLDLSDEERMEFKKLPYNESEYCADLGIKGVNGEYGFTTLERVSARPTLDLNGIFGGYTGEGAKTIIPAKATAKISMRLVPNQKGKDITEKIVKYLKKLAPPTVSIEVKGLHGANPVLIPVSNNGVKACITAFKKAFGADTLFMREGGSIPVVELFDTVLHAPSVLMGLGLPSDLIHSPNENFDLKNFYGGIKASAIFFDEFSNL